MAHTIKLKRTSTAGNKPDNTNITTGELALNTADKSLYIQTGTANTDIVTLYDDGILHLDDTNNRVGIGTTSPTKFLHLNYNSSSTARTADGLAGGAAGGGFLIQNTNSGNSTYANLDFRASTADGRIVYQYTGTQNQGDFHFITDNTNSPATAMTIKNDGKVGIGTTSPSRPLHVVGTALVTGDLQVEGGDIEFNQSSGQARLRNLLQDTYMRFSVNVGGIQTNAINIRGNNAYVGIGSAEGGNSPAHPLDVYNATADTVARFTSGNNRARIHIKDDDTDVYVIAEGSKMGLGTVNALSSSNLTIDASGNLGIGTTAPDSKVTAYTASTGITGLFKLWANTSNNTAADGGAIEWVGSGDKTAIGAKIAATRAESGGKMDMRFYTGRNSDSNHEKMRILVDGKVGIGTTAPTYALHVDAGNSSTTALFESDGVANVVVSGGNNRGSFVVQHSGTTTGAVIAKDGGGLEFGVGANFATNIGMTLDSSGNLSTGQVTSDDKFTVSTSDWYQFTPGTMSATVGSYGMGNGNNPALRQLTFHVPNIAAYSNTGTIPSFGWYSNGGDLLMKLESSSGNLTVKGNIVTDSNSTVIAARKIAARDANGLAIATSDGTSRIDILNNGTTRFNNTVSVDYITGVAQTGSFLDFDDDTTQISNGVTLSSLAALNLKFDTNNNDSNFFGIYANGGTTPIFKLTDAGAATFNNAFTFPTTDGSPNQVLKTDGSGNVTWATEAAASVGTSIADADSDTKIQVEESSDEDKIRFDTGGTERAVMSANNTTFFQPVVLEEPSPHLILKDTTDDDDHKISFRDNSNNDVFIIDTGSDNFNFTTIGASRDIVFRPDQVDRAVLNSSGFALTTAGVTGLVLNEDTSNTQNSARLFFKGTGGTVGLMNVANSLSFRTGMTVDSTSGTERFNIHPDGVTAQVQFKAVDGNATTPGFSFATDTNTGLFRAGENVLSITTAAVERMRINGSGNVGIGTTSPSTKLEVHGTTTLKSHLDFLSPDGTDTISASMLNTDTLSFTGDSGQLFSITDSSTGTIFSVNDISGVPSIEVEDDGTIRLAETFGNVGIGVETPGEKLDVNGNVQAEEFIGDLRGASLFKASAGEAISKGDVVYISGISGNTTVVSKADADDTNKMPAFGIAAASASANNPVEVYTSGILSGIDTSSYSEGDELFVSTTAGAITATPPTGESAALQKIGKVTRSHASSGSIFIIGAGRSNAVPNLNEGKLFVGNSSNQAVADNTMHVDIANSRVGIGTTSPSQKLEVNGYIKVPDARGLYFSNTDANDGRVKIIGSEADDYIQFNVDNSNTHLVRLTTTGLGIGTTSPSQKLDVQDGFIRAQSPDVGGIAPPVLTIGQINNAYQAGITSSVHLSMKAANSSGNFYWYPNSNNPIAILRQNGDFSLGSTNADNYVNTGSYFKPDTNGKFLAVNGASGGFLMLESSTVTNNDQVGGIFFTASAGQSDAHRQVAGIDAIVDVHSTNTALNGADLRFFTKPVGAGTAAPRMTIRSGGNVGIGTVDPSRQLHISGSGATVAAKIEATDGSQASVDIKNSEGEFRIISDGGELSIYDQTDTAERLRIDTAGLVGIGTNNPLYQLDVHTTTGTGLNVTDDNDWATIRVDGGGGTDNVLELTNYGNTGSGSIIRTTGTGHLRLYAGNSEAIRIDGTNQKVGMGGVTLPAENLDVAGIGKFRGTSESSAVLKLGQRDNSSSTALHTIYSSDSGSGRPLGGDALEINTSRYLQIVGASRSSAAGGDVRSWKFTTATNGNETGTTLILYSQTDASSSGSTNTVDRVSFSATSNQNSYINTSGNFGLGTSSPSHKLHVVGDIGVNDNNKIKLGGSGDLELYHNATNSYIINNTGHTYLRSDQDNKDVIIEARLGTGNLGTYFIADSSDQAVKLYHGNSQKFATISNGIRVSSNNYGRIQISDNDSAGLHAYLDKSGLNLNITSQNDTGHGGIALRRYNGSTTLTSFYVDEIGDSKFYRDNGSTVGAVFDASTGRFGIGVLAPTDRLHIYENANRVTYKAQNNTHSAKFEAYGSATAITTDASNGLFLRINDVNKVHLDTTGNFGIGKDDPQAKLQIEEAGIDTTTTSTSATTQVAIDTFAAATFRSARYTIQVTNSTDSTYHLTEILLIHDGTTPNITEYGTIFTGSAEATFDADISSGNVRLLATPATTDSMTFKVVRHCITV